MADRERAEDKTNRTVRPRAVGAAKASNGKPAQTSTRTGSRKLYRVQIETLLAELASGQLIEAWQRVCPFAIATEFGLPDHPGILQDLADLAEVLQPNLENMTADQLCRWVAKYGGAATRGQNRPTLRPQALWVKLPTASS